MSRRQTDRERDIERQTERETHTHRDIETERWGGGERDFRFR